MIWFSWDKVQFGCVPFLMSKSILHACIVDLVVGNRLGGRETVAPGTCTIPNILGPI